MITAAGFADGSGGALQYRSSDLTSWTYDGVLCSRPSSRHDGVWTGSLWECPQLFPVGDAWVLLVSVWDADELYYVAAAVGSYDGARFCPRSWQRLTHGESAYAMSAFVDRTGRQCVMSWLREEPRNDPSLTERAGAHSVVSVVSLTEAGVVVLTPHPDLDAAGRPLPVASAADGSARCSYGEHAVELAVAAPTEVRIRIADNDNTRATFEVSASAGQIRVDRPGRTGQTMPLYAAAHLRVLVDADIVEIFTPESYGAYRIAPAGDPDSSALVVDGASPGQMQAHIW
jgi:beta-fructofuranosidase